MLAVRVQGVSHCPDYWLLYAALVSVCRQLTQRDGDAQTCAAIAAGEREDGARQEAVDAMRKHASRCDICHIDIITTAVI